MDQQKSTLRVSLTFFNYLGLNPFEKTKKIRVYSFIMCMLVLYFLVLVRFRYETVTFKVISDTFESNFTIIHVSSKFISLLIAKPTLKRLLQSTNKFWFKDFEPEFRKEVDKAFRNLKLLFRLFVGFVTFLIGIFAIRPFFDNSLTIACYVPQSVPRIIFVIFNNALVVAAAFSVGSFDMFVCVIIGLISIQFKILNHVIATLALEKVVDRNKEKACLKKLRKCVEYHIFLTDFLRDFSTVISPASLIYFSIAPLSLCFELFFISKSSNLAEIAKSCVYLSAVSIELLFFYCLPATFLLIESERMINVAYGSGWENCYFISIRKTLTIMMQRMQHSQTLTVGKIIQINLETCTNAFRMALSFYTFLQIVDDKTKPNLV